MTKIVGMIKERANFVTEFWGLSITFLKRQQLTMKKQLKLERRNTRIDAKSDFELEKIEDFTSPILKRC